MVVIVEEIFGKAIDPLTLKIVDTYRYILKNKNQMTVAVLTKGATIQSIKYPDRHGIIEDICLGFDEMQGYVDNERRLIGGTVGRVANLVANGSFSMDCNGYIVNKNLKGKHQINGGFIGFHCMIWEFKEQTKNGIVLQHVNPCGFEGYPGKLTATIAFCLDDENQLKIIIKAKAKKETPVNLSNYLFLNLAGHNAQKKGLDEHNVMIKSKKVVDCDPEQIPNGCCSPVKHTIYDLRKFVNLGKRFKKFERSNHPNKGFDNHYCIECPGKLKPMCKIVHPCTGRWLVLSSNQPTVHFFTCNHWPDKEEERTDIIMGKNKAVYEKHGGFCLAAQQYPDAMNHADFPDVFIKPGKTFCYRAVYHFGVD